MKKALEETREIINTFITSLREFLKEKMKNQDEVRKKIRVEIK